MFFRVGAGGAGGVGWSRVWADVRRRALMSCYMYVIFRHLGLSYPSSDRNLRPRRLLLLRVDQS